MCFDFFLVEIIRKLSGASECCVSVYSFSFIQKTLIDHLLYMRFLTYLDLTIGMSLFGSWVSDFFFNAESGNLTNFYITPE